jgi:hypothetical protein
MTLIDFFSALSTIRSIDPRMYDPPHRGAVTVYLTADLEETCWEGRHLQAVLGVSGHPVVHPFTLLFTLLFTRSPCC